MILETVRIITSALTDATIGVNALRSLAPLDAGVTVAPAVTVLDSTTDGRVGRGGVPALETSEFPALLVSPADTPVDQQTPGVKPFPPDATVTVLVRYVTRAVNTAAAERDTSQTLRACWRSLGLLMQPAQSALRTVKVSDVPSVSLVSIRSLQMATLYEDAQDVVVTGGVLVTCHVRDHWTQS